MSQSDFSPSVYLIGWRSIGVVKVGSAYRSRRWKDVAARGGELIDVVSFPDYRTALSVEHATRLHLMGQFPRAYRDRGEATEILSNGCGWSECLRIPLDRWSIAQASLTDRSSDGIGNREGIANRSQIIAVTAPETEAASERSYLGLAFKSNRPVSDARARDAWICELAR